MLLIIVKKIVKLNGIKVPCVNLPIFHENKNNKYVKCDQAVVESEILYIFYVFTKVLMCFKILIVFVFILTTYIFTLMQTY